MKPYFLLLFLLSVIFTVNGKGVAVNSNAIYIQKPGQDSTRLILGERYTRNQIVAKYGEPREFDSFMDDEALYGVVNTYTYASFTIWTLNDTLHEFLLEDNTLILRMSSWNMTLKVGDSTAPYLNISSAKARVTKYSEKINLLVKINGDFVDETIFLYYEGDKVTRIAWHIPV